MPDVRLLLILPPEALGAVMRVIVESILPCLVELAWEAAQTSRLMHELAAPLLDLRPVSGEPLPERWASGVGFSVQPYLWGLIPLRPRHVRIERIDPATRELRTSGMDGGNRRWQWQLRIVSLSPETCHCREVFDFQPGWLGGLLQLVARWLGRRRHRRWKTIAERLEGRLWLERPPGRHASVFRRSHTQLQGTASTTL